MEKEEAEPLLNVIASPRSKQSEVALAVRKLDQILSEEEDSGNKRKGLISDMTGKSRPWVSTRLRIAASAPVVHRLCDSGRVHQSVVLYLASMSDIAEANAHAEKLLEAEFESDVRSYVRTYGLSQKIRPVGQRNRMAATRLAPTRLAPEQEGEGEPCYVAPHASVDPALVRGRLRALRRKLARLFELTGPELREVFQNNEAMRCEVVEVASELSGALRLLVKHLQKEGVAAAPKEDAAE